LNQVHRNARWSLAAALLVALLLAAVPAVLAVTQAAAASGFLEICKEADGPSVSGDFAFDVGGRTVVVPVGACSAPVDVPAGTVTVVEAAVDGYSVSDIRAFPPERMLGRILATHTVQVTVPAGDVSTETVVTFANRAEVAPLKICKVAGAGVAVGTDFTFLAGARTVTVPAGPAPGGYCTVAGTFPVATDVSIAEVVPRGMQVSAIAVAPASRQVGPVNLAGATVVVRIGSGVSEATFTNQMTGVTSLPPTTVPPTTPTTLPFTGVVPSSTSVPPQATTSTTAPPTSFLPTTVPPTTVPPTTAPPTTVPVITLPPTTIPPTSLPPITLPPTTLPPTTVTTQPTTGVLPTTVPPTTVPLTTTVPPTTAPTTTVPSSATTTTSVPGTASTVVTTTTTVPTTESTTTGSVLTSVTPEVTWTSSGPMTELSRTGANTTQLLLASALAFAAGGALLVAGRRCRRRRQPHGDHGAAAAAYGLTDLDFESVFELPRPPVGAWSLGSAGAGPADDLGPYVVPGLGQGPGEPGTGGGAHGLAWRQTGWQPQRFAQRDQDAVVLGQLPLSEALRRRADRAFLAILLQTGVDLA
jgi:carboxypeptidase N regulatory subunit